MKLAGNYYADTSSIMIDRAEVLFTGNKIREFIYDKYNKELLEATSLNIRDDMNYEFSFLFNPETFMEFGLRGNVIKENDGSFYLNDGKNKLKGIYENDKIYLSTMASPFIPISVNFKQWFIFDYSLNNLLKNNKKITKLVFNRSSKNFGIIAVPFSKSII